MPSILHFGPLISAFYVKLRMRRERKKNNNDNNNNNIISLRRSFLERKTVPWRERRLQPKQHFYPCDMVYTENIIINYINTLQYVNIRIYKKKRIP